MGGWAATSQDEVARFFGVHRDTVKAWRGQGMPGVRGSYPLDAIVQWLRREGPWRFRPASGGDNGDPLLAGPTSPAMERYRTARANLAELDLQERLRELLRRETVHEVFGRIASRLRNAGEQLEREHGTEAHQVLDEALDDAVREMGSL